MKSMTGFGYSEYADEELNMTLELRSYNNRFLDMNIFLPPSLSRLEERIRKYLSGKIQRGKVDLFVKLKNYTEHVEVFIDSKNVRAHMEALKKLIAIAGIDDKVHLNHLLRMEGLIKTYIDFDIEKYWKLLHPLLTECFSRYDNSRETEGSYLKKNIVKLINDLSREMKKIKRKAPLIQKRVKKTVEEKFLEYSNRVEDETRILQEISALLIKFDINEEIVRMDSHILNFKSTMETHGVVGKKLDFICQELSREINTISAKSMMAEINNVTLAVKEIIERMREQLRNIE